MNTDIHILIPFFTGIFFSILFIQSALDKVLNWKSELDFNKTHFSKTYIKPLTPLMFALLTLMEITSGLMSATGVFMLLRTGETSIPFYASCLCTTTFICLFLGQRIAKDYGGAQALVSYFILALIEVYFSS